jgi:hypothetical protein
MHDFLRGIDHFRIVLELRELLHLHLLLLEF